jgi:hypothetical protein
MNWTKLKERFPNSEPQIREHLSKTGIKDSRTLINDFLGSKGYTIGYGFIKSLTDYEQRLNKLARTE